MLTKLTSIVDWFDPKKLEHLQAYEFMQEKGQWPEHFIPCDVEFPAQWRLSLLYKISDLYVKEKLAQLTGKVLRGTTN